MPLITFAIEHHRTPDDARERLAAAVDQAKRQYGPMIQSAEWSADRNSVTMNGVGAVVDLRVDASHVHAAIDVPMLGNLLGGQVAESLKQILRKQIGRG